MYTPLKFKIFFIIIFQLSIFPEYSRADTTTVEVTFISNCGFMLSSGGKTIIIMEKELS